RPFPCYPYVLHYYKYAARLQELFQAFREKDGIDAHPKRNALPGKNLPDRSRFWCDPARQYGATGGVPSSKLLCWVAPAGRLYLWVVSFFQKNRQDAFCQSWLSLLLVKSCQKNASLVVTPVKTWVQAVRNRLKLLDVPPARD
ncbi:MAG: hypothetical protein ABSB94_20010, partial [Syntrophorhabdales bacterium]